MLGQSDISAGNSMAIGTYLDGTHAAVKRSSRNGDVFVTATGLRYGDAFNANGLFELEAFTENHVTRDVELSAL